MVKTMFFTDSSAPYEYIVSMTSGQLRVIRIGNVWGPSLTRIGQYQCVGTVDFSMRDVTAEKKVGEMVRAHVEKGDAVMFGVWRIDSAVVKTDT
jgi:hypothetical protein